MPVTVPHHSTTAPDQCRHAVERLEHRVAATVHRLERRLESVRRHHDLSWRSLRHSQRAVRLAIADGTAPTSAEFWESVAEPRSRLLVDSAGNVVADELADMAVAVRHFRSTVQASTRSASWSHDEWDAADVARRALAPVGAVMIDRDPITAVGQAWQRRVRRAALAQRFGHVLRSDTLEIGRIVDSAELELLNHAPWVHGDRLLSAFEIAHQEVRSDLRRRVDELSRLAAPDTMRTPPHRGPATIELRS